MCSTVKPTRSATDILLSIRTLMKLYEQTLSEIKTDCRLSLMEINIISFLHNNPGKDTIGDIAELRMLPKGNVSQGVESLVQKSLIRRTPDKADRRKIHLTLTSQAYPLVEEIEEAKRLFFLRAYDGFSAEETALFFQLNNRIAENARKWLERK